MERPAWTFIILSGLAPRELSDLVTIIILELISFQTIISQFTLGKIVPPTVPFLVIIPGISLLASLSHDSRKERRELALLAYGSHDWQIHLRYFLRGAILVAVGILPIIIASLLTPSDLAFTVLLLVSTILTAGALYSLPSLRRVKSLDFVGRYKR